MIVAQLVKQPEAVSKYLPFKFLSCHNYATLSIVDGKLVHIIVVHYYKKGNSNVTMVITRIDTVDT
jgi:hypothetical protein